MSAGAPATLRAAADAGDPPTGTSTARQEHPPRPPRRALRSVVRFIASVAIVSGTLLIADAGVTLVWQEPISAIVATREQGRLEDRLRQLTAASGADRTRLAGVGDVRRRLARLASLYRSRANEADPIGRISLPTLGRAYVMVEGTDTSTLRKGPGRYPDTAWPGQRGTVAVAGHRTTYMAPFRTIDKLRPGHRVRLRMPYGRFTYRVQYTKIVKPTALWVTNSVGYDRLILSACYPLYSAAKRIVVFARLVDAEPA